MVIPFSARCDYPIRVTRDRSGAWVGRAEPSDETRPHPGLVGPRPQLRLVDGVLTLRRNELPSSLASVGAKDLESASIASFRVGDTLEAVPRTETGFACAEAAQPTSASRCSEAAVSCWR